MRARAANVPAAGADTRPAAVLSTFARREEIDGCGSRAACAFRSANRGGRVELGRPMLF